MHGGRTRLLIFAGALGLGLLADALHVSEKERVEAVVFKALAAVEEKNPAALEGLISPGYFFEGKSREAVLNLARIVMNELSPKRIMVFSRKIRIEPENKAQACLTAAVVPGRESRLPGTILTSWEIHLSREGVEWKVDGIKWRN